MPEDYEPELSTQQCERQDEVDNAVFELCKLMTEDESLKWNMEIVGQIVDFAADLLTNCGHRVHYPTIVEGDDGKDYIEEYWQ